ncbi:urea ABC transporter, substrate binding protein UrtA [Agrilactobacillus composti DSM 18527 = JCM 14202]|uniref:urea ABC transporter substrate-binding protein n=1 Tax=Agrilactobacillus composti TaxID=398555 RepID=UPI00042E038A|nr:urea ABC transporter substrate-binding protein [Agrilactobacillus composti]GAF38347.1 urea ABC transporter, substrate binding protein UrtA [Agrilactobacillus composti DSM 18527 = JCM 14202]
MKKHWHRSWFLLCLSIAFISLLSGCSSAVAGLARPSKTTTTSDKVIKVGILHSLSGTMANSEIPVEQAELLAIKQINANGGVLGKQVVPVIEDGASDNATFAEKADQLLNQYHVATVFGCWTSASRKAVLPIFEHNNGLLWYPVQYEGMESSPNIMYMGAAPNQQIVPAVNFMTQHFGKKVFLVGSDYVFPRTANAIIDQQAKQLHMTVVGEKYVPMGSTDFSTIITQIKKANPDYIVNTLNGGSNDAFFKQLHEAGIAANTTPTISASVAEQEVKGIGNTYMAGQYTSWNYYQSQNNPENKAFIKAFRAANGANSVTDDPIEAGYNAVHLWAKAVKKAGTTKVAAVRQAAKGLSYAAPEGKVTIDGDNQHLYKTVRIGKVASNGVINTVWQSPQPVKPDPYLKGYAWAGMLNQGQ